jgi:hypothetical protein
VTDIDLTAATLNATVNPVGYPTNAYFVYGTDSSLANGAFTTPIEGVGNGITPVESGWATSRS